MTAFALMIQASIAAGGMALLVMMIRLIARRSLPHSFTIILWGLVFFAFMSPFVLPVFVSVQRFAPEDMEYVSETIVYVLAIEQAVASGAMASAGSASRGINGELLNVIWLGGVVALACFFLALRIRMGKYFSCAVPVNTNAFGDTGIYNNFMSDIKRPVAIFMSNRVQTPITYGVLKPKIILPTGFFHANEQLTEHALHHEAQHIRHMDSLFNTLWLALVCVHWFNPLAWLCWALLKKDMEFRCDAAVVKRLGYSGKAGYARSLLELTPVIGNPRPTLAMALSSSNVKTRIVHIMSLRKPTFFSRFIAVVLVIAMLPVFFVSVSATVLPVTGNSEIRLTTVFITSGGADYAVIRMRPADSDNRYHMELSGFMSTPPEGLEFSGRGYGIGGVRMRTQSFSFAGADLITEDETASRYKILRISSFETDDDIEAYEALHLITTRARPWFFGYAL